MRKRKKLLEYLVFVCIALSEILHCFGSLAFSNVQKEKSDPMELKEWCVGKMNK